MSHFLIVMLNVVSYAECHYAECRYAECHGTQKPSEICLLIKCLSVKHFSATWFTTKGPRNAK
jgi:hypothetical protein